jgi:hypothetical protein
MVSKLNHLMNLLIHHTLNLIIILIFQSIYSFKLNLPFFILFLKLIRQSINFFCIINTFLKHPYIYLKVKFNEFYNFITIYVTF